MEIGTGGLLGLLFLFIGCLNKFRTQSSWSPDITVRKASVASLDVFDTPGDEGNLKRAKQLLLQFSNIQEATLLNDFLKELNIDDPIVRFQLIQEHLGWFPSPHLGLGVQS